MALNGKYRSVDEVIEQIHRDYSFTDINKSDAVEWIGEILELIGEEDMFVQKQTDGNKDLCHPLPIEIRNGRAELPCDLMRLISVKDAETGIVLNESLDNFMPTFNNCKDGEIKYVDNSSVPDSTSGCDNPDGKGVERKLNYKEFDKTYRLNNNFIFTNYDNGYLVLSYTGLTMDDDGYPMIPDDVSFMNACKFHVATKHAFKLAMQNKINPQFYQMIERDRDWYVGQATMRAVLPNEDKLESLKNMWVRLIPQFNRQRDGFKTANIQERRINRYTVTGNVGGVNNKNGRDKYYGW